jgi:hypothetical protein
VDRCETGVNHGIQRDGLKPGMQLVRVCSNASLYVPPALIHGTRTCTQFHSHVERTIFPPSAASGRETGLESLLRVGVSTPSAPPTRLQLGHCLPHGMIHRDGAVAQLPGAMRMSLAAPYVERRTLSVADSRHLR